MKRPLLLLRKDNSVVAQIEDGDIIPCPTEPVIFAVPIEGWFQEKEGIGKTVKTFVKYSTEPQSLQPGKYTDVSFRENGDGAIAVRYNFELTKENHRLPSLGVVTRIYDTEVMIDRLIATLRHLNVNRISVWWTCGSTQNREFFRKMLAANISVEIVISRARTATTGAQNATEAANNARNFVTYMQEFTRHPAFKLLSVVIGNEADSPLYFNGSPTQYVECVNTYSEALKSDGWIVGIGAATNNNSSWMENILSHPNLVKSRLDTVNIHAYGSTPDEHHLHLDRCIQIAKRHLPNAKRIVGECCINMWNDNSQVILRASRIKEMWARYNGKDIDEVYYFRLDLPKDATNQPSSGAALVSADLLLKNEPFYTTLFELPR